MNHVIETWLALKNGIFSYLRGKKEPSLVREYSPRLHVIQGQKIASFNQLSQYQWQKGEKIQFLRALKNMSAENVEQWIDDSLAFSMPNFKPDLIVGIESSKPLQQYLIEKLSKAYLHESLIYGRGILKNEVENVVIDMTKISEKTVSTLNRQLYRARHMRASHFPKQFLSLISNWLRIDKAIQSKIRNKRVLVVDDIFTSGQTLLEAITQVKKFHPAEVYGVVLLRS